MLTDDVESSKPITEISSPMRNLLFRSSVYPAMAIWSLAKTKASISGLLSIRAPISAPQYSEKSPCAIILSVAL